MPSKQILVYQASEIMEPKVSSPTDFHHWSPSIKNIIPPDKPKKYFLYTLFLWLGIFKNKQYSSYFFSEGKVISSFLVVPANFRWPFMGKNSIQFTYVITDRAHRGKGLAWQGIYQASTKLKSEGIESFWYVTSSANESSQKLAEKMGFELKGEAQIQRLFFGLIKIIRLDENS